MFPCHPACALPAVCFVQIVVSLVMVNLLISIITESYERIRRNEKHQLLRNQVGSRGRGRRSGRGILNHAPHRVITWS